MLALRTAYVVLHKTEHSSALRVHMEPVSAGKDYTQYKVFILHLQFYKKKKNRNWSMKLNTEARNGMTEKERAALFFTVLISYFGKNPNIIYALCKSENNHISINYHCNQQMT